MPYLYHFFPHVIILTILYVTYNLLNLGYSVYVTVNVDVCALWDVMLFSLVLRY
jgi:hypothetical protein